MEKGSLAMTIHILRSDTKQTQAYEIAENISTLLQALSTIKATQDATLTFGAGCRASVCGTCAVRVNGKEVLSCAYKVQDGDVVEPLNYHEVLRDLKVNKHKALRTLSQSQAWLHEAQEASLTPSDEKETAIQTDCILCDSCYSACPVYAVNPKFLGPFALTRAYRYSLDKRESNVKEMIDAIQDNAVWDCTLCGECTLACPKGIDPKMDIMLLRGTSLNLGHSDPSFAQQSFGSPDFSGGF
jgi:fumarate reductase iron-sulfur subunit